MAAFIGTHLLLSHQLRGGMVRRFGEQGFLGIYSLIGLGTFSWTAVAFGKASSGPQL